MIADCHAVLSPKVKKDLSVLNESSGELRRLLRQTPASAKVNKLKLVKSLFLSL